MEISVKKCYCNGNFGISSALLKWIAVFSMVTDHFAASLYQFLPGSNITVYRMLRNVGRIAFPIYCFLLVEGFFHTGNRKRYLRNLVLFGIISELPFNMAIFGKIFYPGGQNVYFTLALGICAMLLLERLELFCMKHFILQIITIIAFLLIGEVLEVDYHWKGIAYIILFYYLKKLRIEKKHAMLIAALAFAIYEPAAIFAFIPIYLYNGKRGYQLKYMFYAVYPLHLAVFGVLRLFS